MNQITPPTPSNAGGNILAPPSAAASAGDSRDQMVAIATSFEGCSAAPATRQRYCDLLCTSPDDFANPQARSDAEVQSGCSRTRLGFEFNAGERDPLLLNKYRDGYAVADFETTAKNAKAWRPPSFRPDRGDGILWNGPAGLHILTCIAWDGDVLVSIDGGQRDASHFEAILRRRRTYATTATGATLDGYPIVGVVDWPTMAIREEW